MKFTFYFLFLVSSFGAVNSAIISSAFEAVFFYYAYQIDAAALAQSEADGTVWTQTIGLGCKGKDCTLAEFVERLLKAPAAEALTATSMGDTTSPEVYSTAMDIIDNWNYKSTHNLVGTQIIKDASANWGEMVGSVADKVQAARSVIPESDLVKQFGKCIAALRWAQAARLTEMVGDVTVLPLTGQKAKVFQDAFPDAELKTITSNLATDDTGSAKRYIDYTDLDYKGMAGTDSAKLKEFEDWAAVTPKKTKPTKSYVNHRGWSLVYQEKAVNLERACPP